MTKEYSNAIKGIAILMMLFYHLFNDPVTSAGLFSLVSFGGVSLPYLLTRAAGPVEFFLILGGYGLYSIYKRGDDPNRLRRIWRCYRVYWLCLVVFVPLACWLTDDPIYPGTLENAFLSVTGIYPTWYMEAWFLLPYLMLSAAYPLLMRLLERRGSAATLALSLVVYTFTVVLTQRDWIDLGQHSPYAQPVVRFLQFLLPFCIGAVMKKERLLERLRQSGLFGNRLPVALLLLAVVAARICSVTYFFVAPIYATAVVILLYLLRLRGSVLRFFAHLGKYSLYMWLVHAWLYKYLFDGLIYRLHYPLAIFLVLVLASYAVSRLLAADRKNTLSRHFSVFLVSFFGCFV